MCVELEITAERPIATLAGHLAGDLQVCDAGQGRSRVRSNLTGKAVAGEAASGLDPDELAEEGGLRGRSRH
jgi:hypothetical protein